jgi:sugar/nucleoside kinase (ribokinase family)
VALGRDEGWLEALAVPVREVADTNRAGDAFVEGMLLGHLEGARWPSACAWVRPPGRWRWRQRTASRAT